MATYTFTKEQTGLDRDVLVEATWLIGSDPFVCRNRSHGGSTCYDPAVCVAHIVAQYGDI